MSRRPPHVVTTVDLPSGKVLEIVRPDAGESYTRVRPPAPGQDRDLCVCQACSADLVEPVEWEAAGPMVWRVGLYCPNCDHASEGVFSQACVDRFDERLDDATAMMINDLKRLEQATMADDAERLIGALNADAILPEDF